MYTIEKDIENKIIIKNSKFITNIFYVNNNIEIEERLNYIKKKYKDATHNTYAYITTKHIKCSDDNEPANTAGKPMLNVLQSKNLCNILVVTTRYFGGIKLGANGLIRAYSTSISEALNKCNILNLIKGYNVDIIFNYKDTPKIEHILKKENILSKAFNNTIQYNVNIDEDILNTLKNFKDIKIIINENIYIKEKK